MRRESGFTLIELVVVVVIIGLLAAIALPRLGGAKERAYVAAMRSDLRNLSTHEESHFYDFSVYTPDVNALKAAGWEQTQMITINIVEATASGWSAVASHLLSSVQCGIYVGSASPVGAATQEGVIGCS